jgi:hypothetical protein
MKINNTMELTIYLFLKVQPQIKIQLDALKIPSWRTMEEKKN